MKITSCGVCSALPRHAYQWEKCSNDFTKPSLLLSSSLSFSKDKLFLGTQYEKGMEALSSMDRVKQMEAIQGYNSMKSNLMEYLKKFAENGKVVRQEDIQEFFQQMQASKRQRVEIPKFCK